MRCAYVSAARVLAGVTMVLLWGPPLDAQLLGRIRNVDGLQLLVPRQDERPLLRIVLPGHPVSDRAIEVLFPEHVTARRHGASEPTHLYLVSSVQQGARPTWRRVGRSLEYERELSGAIHLLARATLEDDGVRFHYEFTNRSDVAYDMIYAVTDPRLTSEFNDQRLERTYVHHADGFDLLASETPARLTLPLDRWLPLRYLAAFTWPVPAQLVQTRDDGITYYYDSRAVDQPFIATLSADHAWVVASFSRKPGNVWSNPALTCQHVDPQVALPARDRAIVEMKILVFRGSLDDVLKKVVSQRSALR